MHLSNAIDLDGMYASFFTLFEYCWGNISYVCLYFLNDDVNISLINRTIISIILKPNCPKRLNEFQLISLYTVILQNYFQDLC